MDCELLEFLLEIGVIRKSEHVGKLSYLIEVKTLLL